MRFGRNPTAIITKPLLLAESLLSYQLSRSQEPAYVANYGAGNETWDALGATPTVDGGVEKGPLLLSKPHY